MGPGSTQLQSNSEATIASERASEAKFETTIIVSNIYVSAEMKSDIANYQLARA